MTVERKWNGTEWVVTGSSGMGADQTPVALDSLRVFASESVSLSTGNTWYDVPGLEVTLPAAPFARRVKVTYQAYVYMNTTSNGYVDTQVLVDGASPNARDQFTIGSAESVGRYTTNYSHVWLTVPAGVSHTFKVQARTSLTGANVEISYAGSRTWLEYEVWPTIMAAPGENLLPGSPLVYESRGSSGVNTLPIGTFATSLEIPGARIEMPVKAGDVVFYTFNGWMAGGSASGDARMGCEPSGVAHTKYTGWQSAQSYLRQPPGVYSQQALTDWLVADEDGTLVLQLRGYGTTGATSPQANYVGIKAWIPKGQKGDKGDTGDPGWKPRPVWQDVQTQHNINSTSANVSLNPPTSISWTNQESYPMMVRYEGAGLCYMTGATDLMYLRPEVSGGTSLGIGVEWRVDFPDTEGGTYFPAFHLAAMAQVAPGATVTFEITGRSTSPMDGYIRYFRHQAWAVGPA